MKLREHRRDDGFSFGRSSVEIVEVLIPIGRSQPFAAMHGRPAKGIGAGKLRREMRQGIGGGCRLQSGR